MAYIKITTEFGDCWANTIGPVNREKKEYHNYCAVCNGKIKSEDSCHLILNNWVMFDNCCVHTTCQETIDEEFILKIRGKFIDYKEKLDYINKNYKCWIQL